MPAPNAVANLKAKLKSIFSSKKTKKTADPVDKPAAAAAAPVAATAAPVTEDAAKPAECMLCAPISMSISKLLLLAGSTPHWV